MDTLGLSLLSGLGIGILGSAHCVGMCGPIALALPRYGDSTLQNSLGISLYHLGRAFTYAVMGGIVGSLGMSMRYFGWQQGLSIVAGVLILLGLFFAKYNPQNKLFTYLHSKVKAGIGHFLQPNKGVQYRFALGAVNGLLPCGLVYVALTSAMASGTALSGSLLMFGFGFGTVPLLAATQLLGNQISMKARARLTKLVPVFVAITAHSSVVL